MPTETLRPREKSCLLNTDRKTEYAQKLPRLMGRQTEKTQKQG